MTSHTIGQATGPELSAITVAMVKLHRRYYGKGPTEAKTYAINDTILCMLHGGFTTVERTLMADGKREDVERIRRSFQDTMRERFIEVIEGTLERKVIGYMSQIHADPDVAIELFLLEPHGEKLLGEHELHLPVRRKRTTRTTSEPDAAAPGLEARRTSGTFARERASG